MERFACLALLISMTLLGIPSSSCQAESTDYSDNHAKVLILGAGATGIKAAQIFHENNMDDFLIIEGADYIGGRIKEESFANVTINLGAEWVSPAETPIIDLVLNQWNLDAYPMDWDSVVIRGADGHEFTDEEADPIWDKFEEAFFIKSREIGQDILDNDKHDISLKTALHLSGWLAKTPLERVIEWYTADFETAHRSDVTALLSLIFVNYEDSYFMIDKLGYGAIFDKIAPFLKSAEFSDHIRLNQRINRIDYDNELVTVYCDDGTVYTGERALVTFSVGVLQSDLVEFNPKLPEWKREVLFQMDMGSYGKVYMKFPDKFWDDEQHLLHVNDRANYFPYFMNFDALGSYLPDGTHVLVAHVVGEEAWRLHYQDDADTKAEVEELLQGIFGLDAPPRASEFRVVTEWLDNPLTMGTYSDWPVQLPRDCIPKLQSRVGRVFFGGEHTDELYNGYVIAALRSGEREATKILSCMNGDGCPKYEPPSEDVRPRKYRKIRVTP